MEEIKLETPTYLEICLILLLFSLPFVLHGSSLYFSGAARKW